MMRKSEEERYVLELANPILSDIYGDFDVDENQTDSPDAAIFLSGGVRKKIGIEITSVDKQEIQQYLNDEKITKPIITQQLDALQLDGSHSSQPTKKISIPFPKEYIFDGVIKKKDKYSRYIELGDYDEMIVVAFSSQLQTDHEHFKDYHKLWTGHLLGKNSFPFDKVIFVSLNTRDAVVVYDKDLPRINAPQADSDKELGITTMSGPILPFGKTVNLNTIFDNEPLIPYQSKNELIRVRKAKKKEKRKAQSTAEKVNAKK